MDTLLICCCTFWRQVFHWIVDLCKAATHMYHIISNTHLNTSLSGWWTYYWLYCWNFGRCWEQSCCHSTWCFPNPCCLTWNFRNANAGSRNSNLHCYSQYRMYMSLALYSDNLTGMYMAGCRFSVQCTARLSSRTMYCIRQAAINAGACWIRSGQELYWTSTTWMLHH